MCIDDKFSCNIRQALEYLAFGWEPMTREDEILNGRNRKLFFEKNYTKNEFLIEQAALKLKNYIKDKNLVFNAVVDKDDTNINTSKKVVRISEGKISQVKYIDALRIAKPSDIMLVKHSIEGDYSKSIVNKQPCWDDTFDIFFCKDLSYYSDPYGYYGESEYDLFYIKTHDGRDIRYIDVCFCFEDLKDITEVKTEKNTQYKNKEYLNDKIIKKAKFLKKNNPDITNNKAATTIRNELFDEDDIKEGQYPSLQKIRNIILKIIPTKTLTY